MDDRAAGEVLDVQLQLVRPAEVQVETAQAIGGETVLPGRIDARGLYLRLVERDGAVLFDLVIVDAVDAGTLDQAQEVLAAGRIDVDRAPFAGLPEAAVGFVAPQVAGIDVADAALELDLVPVHADRHVDRKSTRLNSSH